MIVNSVISELETLAMLHVQRLQKQRWTNSSKNIWKDKRCEKTFKHKSQSMTTIFQ